MKYIAKLSRAVILLIALVFCTSAAFAQDAIVKRNVYLRPAPPISNQPIRKLIPPDEVDLIIFPGQVQLLDLAPLGVDQ